MDQKELTIEMLNAVMAVAEKHDIKHCAEIALAAMSVAVSMQVALYDEETCIRLYLGVLAMLGKNRREEDGV